MPFYLFYFFSKLVYILQSDSNGDETTGLCWDTYILEHKEIICCFDIFAWHHSVELYIISSVWSKINTVVLQTVVTSISQFGWTQDCFGIVVRVI